MEEHLIAPLPPVASGRHTGQKRKEKGSAQVSDPSKFAGPDFQVPANDGMFGDKIGVVIAMTGVNICKGSLYDFDCVTYDFLGQHAFELSHPTFVHKT